ncbi:hypothetical protein C0W35_17840 [Photobacterium kishitanii]|uniref:hypothetical protein n=1 Tax=Photobacterium kishitanii TaxID=318456 RepID=UPI000D173356|nr:hypothetical protein [Photobacterium kishitanii]PSU90734.1 hypothetical protein C0W35_17840 [Photobacterium kishitanii]
MRKIVNFIEDAKVINDNLIEVYSKSIYGNIYIKYTNQRFIINRNDMRNICMLCLGVLFSFFLDEGNSLLLYCNYMYLLYFLLRIIIFEIRAGEVNRIINKLNIKRE